MAKVVLFFPNPFSATRKYPGLPLAVLAVSRILHAEGVPIRIVAPNLFPNYTEEILRECEDAVCFGVSAMAGYQIHDGLAVCREVRKRFPKLPIVWGGWHPSILPGETVADSCVDIVVRGQGERAFAELYHALERGDPLDGIASLTFKRDGKIVSTPDRKPESLDAFPPIPYELVDVEKCLYSSEMGLRTLMYYSSCGCPGRCGFCVEQIVNKRRWMGQSAERIVADMESLVAKYHIDGLAIIDSNFFVDQERVRKMCTLMEEKGVRLAWGSANGRPDQLAKYKDETWELVARTGCKTILIGAESGSQETLDFMHKDIKVADTLVVAEKTKKYDIKTFFSFLVGLPRSSDPIEANRLVQDEYRETLELLDRLIAINPRLRIMLFVYLPYPSSTLFERAAALGVELPHSLEEWSHYLMAAEDATNIIQRQKWISKADMRKTLMISSYIFFFLDPDSVLFIKTRLKNPLVRFAGLAAFYLFKAICRFRWTARFFVAPLDFYFYYFLRHRLNMG